MSRNLVICLDGTRNEPESGATNVARLYDLAEKDAAQVVYYDPGVGTMGDRSATTSLGRSFTRVSGLVIGHGVKENVEEAYRFLMHTYRPGDRVFVFGFSRGAYTARALVGMLRTVGLLRPSADNLVPYALKLYARPGERDQSQAAEQAFWRQRSEFTRRFGNPDFPEPFSPQIDFLGVWDTVKSVGWLNWKAQYEQAHWPFTRKVSNVRCGRHALAIDERRRPYAEYRFDEREVAAAGDRLREMWFAGVHSDVGGVFLDDHRLSDIALKWMTDEAAAAGLRVDGKAYVDILGVPPGQDLPRDLARGRVHTNGIGWAVLGGGWHRRPIRPGDEIHPSVLDRIELTRNGEDRYGPRLPEPAPAPRLVTPT
ncbi:DUF2235 domain-containing protein [Geodermatophilus sp. SYSU D00710]